MTNCWRFCQSIDPNSAKGWPTTFDVGRGFVFDVLDVGGTILVDVIFIEAKIPMRRLNSFNLVHVKDIYNEAMRAEHSPRLGY